MSRNKKNPRVSHFKKWGPDVQTGAGAPVEKIDELRGGNHFATRECANDFVRLMRSLPDPDPILEQMGKGITALPGLLSDSHMESVWSVRCSVTSGAEWFISPGADGWRETEAAEAFSSELAALDIPRIIEDDDRRGGVWVRAAGNYLAGEGRALVYWQYRGETAPVV